MKPAGPHGGRPMQCKARNRAGKRCGKAAAAGREVCRLHGGASLRGVAHPNFAHGRYSKCLPDRLIGRYEAAQRDPELVAMRDEIALVDVRIGELLSRLDSGESGATWALLRQRWG